MFIFALLNLICLVLVLSKCIWYSESSRITTAKRIDRLFNVPKKEIDLVLEEQNMFEGDPEHRCSDCEDDGDYSGADSTSEEQNPAPSTNSEKDSEKDSEHINDDSSTDSAVMVDYVEKSKDLISQIKDELEKKND
jgi:hypothetical protein